MEKKVKTSSMRQLRIAVIVSITVLLLWSQLWGLNPDKEAEQYLIDQWEMSDGFPANEITSIAQTPDGYLWLATSKGLVRFDGLKFSIITFADREEISPLETVTPLKLFLDKAGILWIGSSAGLTSYHCRTGEFKTYTSSHGLSGGRVSCIMEDMRGNLWICYMSGYVDRLFKGKFTSFNESHGLKKGVNAIIEDGKGSLLFATRENGVFEYKEGNFIERNIPRLDKLHLYTVCEDRRGVLWLGTNSGLFRVTDEATLRYTRSATAGNRAVQKSFGNLKNPRNTKSFSSNSSIAGLPDNQITSILEDSERNLWAGTLDGGLVRIKRGSGGNISFEKVLKTKTSKILCLFEDEEKSLWIGTLDSGLKQLKDGKFTSFLPLEARREILLSVYQDSQGDAWVGTFDGKLFHCRGNDIIEILEPPGLTSTGITAITEDAHGNLWFGTNGRGVFQKKKEIFLQFTTKDGLADNQVNSIYRDSRGNLWFCTSAGLSVREFQCGIIASISTPDVLPGKVVHNIYEDRAHNLWIAKEKGIALLTKAFAGVQGAVFSKSVPWPPEAESRHYLKGISVTCIHEDTAAQEDENPTYWITTDGAGLKRLRLKDGKITSFITTNGLTTDILYKIFADRRGNFWLMSNRGVLRVKKSELDRLGEGTLDYLNCVSFGRAEGMQSSEFNNEFSRHSAFQTNSGELWFVTKQGISIVNPEKMSINKTPPPVVIEEAFFNQEPIPLHLDAGAYRLRGEKNFRVHFTAPTFLSPGKVKFKYRLTGIDDRWVYLSSGEERVARYKDLKPGSYTFAVTACNAEGIWNNTDAVFSFLIKPLFHQTMFFKIAVLIIFAGLVYTAFYIYKKRPFEKRIKYKGSSLNSQFAELCIKRLKHLMDLDKLYRDENLTLKTLAEKLSIPSHILSRILNEKLNRNFSDFINYYRVEEAKEIFISLEGCDKKISAVAYDVGFNALTAFYKAFKKHTGKTPKQFKKINDQ